MAAALGLLQTALVACERSGECEHIDLTATAAVAADTAAAVAAAMTADCNYALPADVGDGAAVGALEGCGAPAGAG